MSAPARCWMILSYTHSSQSFFGIEHFESSGYFIFYTLIEKKKFPSHGNGFSRIILPENESSKRIILLASRIRKRTGRIDCICNTGFGLFFFLHVCLKLFQSEIYTPAVKSRMQSALEFIGKLFFLLWCLTIHLPWSLNFRFARNDVILIRQIYCSDWETWRCRW